MNNTTVTVTGTNKQIIESNVSDHKKTKKSIRTSNIKKHCSIKDKHHQINNFIN